MVNQVFEIILNSQNLCFSDFSLGVGPTLGGARSNPTLMM